MGDGSINGGPVLTASEAPNDSLNLNSLVLMESGDESDNDSVSSNDAPVLRSNRNQSGSSTGRVAPAKNT